MRLFKILVQCTNLDNFRQKEKKKRENEHTARRAGKKRL